MNWMNDIGGMLQRYTNPAQQQDAPDSAATDFEQAAAVAPRGTLAESLSEAFRSDQTPPFANIVSNLFGSSNGQQQAGLLNTLLAAVGPGVLTSVLSRTGGGALGGLLGGGQTQITPEQATQIPLEAVHEIAREAEKRDPTIVDRAGEFYAQHPTLVQTLGAGALAVVMGKMAKKL